MGKHIWFISFWYPPINWTATERALKYTRSLVRAGWKVTVFTADTQGFARQHLDPSREDDIPKGNHCTVIRVPVWFAGTSFDSREQRFISRLKRFILGGIITRFFGDSGWIWVVPLYRALRKQAKRVGLPHYVLASGPPFLPFWAVHRICGGRIPYALDYRDLWSRNPHRGRFSRGAHRLVMGIESRVNAQARMLITVSEGCAKRLREAGDTDLITLYNYPDKRYLEYAQRDDRIDRGCFNPRYFNIVYAGTLHQRRNLDAVAQAIKELEPALRNEVRVHYYGLYSWRAVESFDTYGVSEILLTHGNVDKGIIMAAMKEADLLLSIVSNLEESDNWAINGVMTTKIFDYILSGTPIINVAPRTNELYQWLETHKFDEVLNVTAGQSSVIRDHIAVLLTEKRGVRRHAPYPDTLLWEHQMEVVLNGIAAHTKRVGI